MDLKDRMRELARIGRTPTPVMTVYLNTRWADEHQRDRVRIFLKNELARARGAPPPRAAEADLSWVPAGNPAALRCSGAAESLPGRDRPILSPGRPP